MYVCGPETRCASDQGGRFSRAVLKIIYRPALLDVEDFKLYLDFALGKARLAPIVQVPPALWVDLLARIGRSVICERNDHFIGALGLCVVCPIPRHPLHGQSLSSAPLRQASACIL